MHRYVSLNVRDLQRSVDFCIDVLSAQIRPPVSRDRSANSNNASTISSNFDFDGGGCSTDHTRIAQGQTRMLTWGRSQVGLELAELEGGVNFGSSGGTFGLSTRISDVRRAVAERLAANNKVKDSGGTMQEQEQDAEGFYLNGCVLADPNGLKYVANVCSRQWQCSRVSMLYY